MRVKIVSGVIIMLLAGVIILSIGSVMAAPTNAEDKNDNLSLLDGEGITWLIMENGAGPKRGWGLSGEVEGMSVVYLDTTKLGAKAVDKLLAGEWEYSNTYPDCIYKRIK